MSRKSNEEEVLEDLFAGQTLSETNLSVLGSSPAMAKGQDAISTAMANGRAMQNAVAQAQNAHTASQAQTTNGVATLLTRGQRMKRKKRIWNFLERARLFES